MATAGKLVVTVMEARVFNDLDTFGKMDPYVEIEHRMEKFKTKVAKDQGKDPKFNEIFTYNIKYIGDDFTMRILTKNSIMADELLGEATIKCTALCLPGFDDWFDLTIKGKKSGSIRFSADWQPSES